MVTLVLAIDRDNDLGRKTGLRSPVIGREANIEAALKLGLADPEESDTNTMLAAIRTYDNLVADGIETEVVTICGDLPVGTKSDMKISAALDRVIRETGATSAIMVSDGAEDRELEPIIRSRLRIDSTRLVIVQQSQAIEDTYYKIINKLQDPKIQRKFVVPFALAILVYGILYMFGYGGIAFGGVFVTIGLYLLIKVAGWEEQLREFYEEMVTGTGEKVSVVTWVIALIVVLIGIIVTVTEMDKTDDDVVSQILTIISDQGILLYLLFAFGIIDFGRTVDTFLRDGIININFLRFVFMLVALGFIIPGLIDIIRVAFLDKPWDPEYLWAVLKGLAIGVIGFWLHYALRQQLSRDNDADDWL